MTDGQSQLALDALWGFCNAYSVEVSMRYIIGSCLLTASEPVQDASRVHLEYAQSLVFSPCDAQSVQLKNLRHNA